MGLRKLYQAGFLTPRGAYLFLYALAKEGTNLMALLRFAKAKAPQQIAIALEGKTYSYQQLYEESLALAGKLQQLKNWQAREQLAIAAFNSYELILLIFAASKSGLNLYLLNPEITQAQFDRLHKKINFDHLVVHQNASLELEGKTERLEPLCHLESKIYTAKKKKSGLLIVLTSGTSGNYKTAARKTATTPFIAPFMALLKNAQLHRYRSVFVATPIYHGFGLAAMIMSIALRASVYLQRQFKASTAASMIKTENIEVLTAVPLIYDRLLEKGREELKSLRTVLCGGAPLRSSLVLKSQEALGDILFNLYGSSEAGFCIMATPKDLKKEPNTIGKAIRGVHIQIKDSQAQKVPDGQIGNIYIKSSWTVGGSQWVDTGDLAYKKEGLLFISGRSDDMIISGGENVYPIELEEILLQHPHIKKVAVIGVDDEEFGARLLAFVQLKENLSKEYIFKWLKNKAARHQIPKDILILNQIPYNSLGKADQKALKDIIRKKY